MYDQTRKGHQDYFHKLRERLEKTKREKMLLFNLEKPVHHKMESEPVITEPEYLYKRGGTQKRKISTLADVVDLIKQAEGKKGYKEVLAEKAKHNPLLKARLLGLDV